MSLFSFGDCMPGEEAKASPLVIKSQVDSGFSVNLPADLENLKNGQSLFFETDGAWSNIDLLDALLKITGPASVDFCTWSIGTDAIRKITEWQENGNFTSLRVILDQGIRNRKPEILQQATGAFKALRLIKCHAKICVVQNKQFSFTIIGSANFTNNPRKEAGVVVRCSLIANAYLKQLRKEFGL